jgi:uncharacterized membrane protein YedE/YeeE
MTEFTPLTSLLGGVLIGLAAVLLMALNGRIAGLTGVVAGLLPPAPAGDWPWRLAFVLAAASAPAVVLAATGKMPAIEVTAGTAVLVLGGLLVGIGATLGGGCTSGHGICGLARFSLRSVVAVLTFMASTAATVIVSRYLLGA